MFQLSDVVQISKKSLLSGTTLSSLHDCPDDRFGSTTSFERLISGLKDTFANIEGLPICVNTLHKII